MATPEQYITDNPRPVSEKQIEVLRIIARGNPDGSPVDMWQILERVSYPATSNTIRFILRYMRAQGRIKVAGMFDRPCGESKSMVRSLKTFIITDLGLMLIKNR